MSKNFVKIERITSIYRPVEERIQDFEEVERKISIEDLQKQASRCMNCGIPFCHGSGCPLGNNIPEFNEMVNRGNWREAWILLNEKSPFPEFTSRICPALCEEACCAGINFEPVMVRQIEKLIVETAFAKGFVTASLPKVVKNKKVAIIGAGPAGLAAAHELNLRGYKVTVYDRNPLAGGLLRYGIPSFKLEKSIIDRRIALMKKSGINFIGNTEIGVDVSATYLMKKFDAILIATGTPIPRNLSIPGRQLEGIHFAVDFLNGCESAKDRHVLIIGGGDTGSDCVGMSIRQGAKSIQQIEIMPEPPKKRAKSTPWPNWSYKLRTSSSHKEGGERRWALQSLKFVGEKRVEGVDVVNVKWDLSIDGKPLKFTVVEGKEEVLKADIVMLAMGFLKNTRDEILLTFDLPESEQVFIAGDAANGPSLVVKAIVDGKKAAEKIDKFLERNK